MLCFRRPYWSGLACAICAARSFASLRSWPKKALPKRPPANRLCPRRPKTHGARETKARKFELPGFTPQREAAALSFVREHHAELALLLGHLKGVKLKEYERAIRELFRSSERLAQIKDRDEDRYKIELQVWKLDSRIRLMAARLSMTPGDESLQEDLRAAFLRKTDLQLQRLELDRARAEARQRRLEASIEKLTEARERLADRSVKQLLMSVTKRPAGLSKPKRAERSLFEVKTPSGARIDKPGSSPNKK